VIPKLLKNKILYLPQNGAALEKTQLLGRGETDASKSRLRSSALLGCREWPDGCVRQELLLRRSLDWRPAKEHGRRLLLRKGADLHVALLVEVDAQLRVLLVVVLGIEGAVELRASGCRRHAPGLGARRQGVLGWSTCWSAWNERGRRLGGRWHDDGEVDSIGRFIHTLLVALTVEDPANVHTLDGSLGGVNLLQGRLAAVFVEDVGNTGAPLFEDLCAEVFKQTREQEVLVVGAGHDIDVECQPLERALEHEARACLLVDPGHGLFRCLRRHLLWGAQRGFLR
jgi:hypothetical protein